SPTRRSSDLVERKDVGKMQGQTALLVSRKEIARARRGGELGAEEKRRPRSRAVVADPAQELDTRLSACNSWCAKQSSRNQHEPGGCRLPSSPPHARQSVVQG